MDMLLFLVPVWIAFLVGVIVGWAWKPRWVTTQGYNGKFNCLAVPSPLVAVISSPVKGLGSIQSLNSFGPCAMAVGVDKEQISTPFIEEIDCG